MAYSPTQQRPIETGDLNMDNLIAKRDGEKARKLFPKVVGGQAFGEMELPEAAPLVFPALDKVHNPDANKIKKGLNLVHDYNDRRAQYEYNQRNPDSALALPEDQKPSFSSSLADPNHPAFQGSWLTLFSGGKIKPLKGNPQEREQRKMRKRELKGKKPRKKTLMKQNVVYLMIVNMPTEEELEQARQVLASEEMEKAQERANKIPWKRASRASDAGLDGDMGDLKLNGDSGETNGNLDVPPPTYKA